MITIGLAAAPRILLSAPQAFQEDLSRDEPARLGYNLTVETEAA